MSGQSVSLVDEAARLYGPFGNTPLQSSALKYPGNSVKIAFTAFVRDPRLQLCHIYSTKYRIALDLAFAFKY
jgi:hypothetical protein